METFHSEKEFYEHLGTQGKLTSGDSGECVDIKKVPWFNEKLFLEGIAFAKRNIFSIFFNLVMMLFFGYLYKPMANHLLKSGHFTKPAEALKRIVRTGRALRDWFDPKIKYQDSQGWKTFQRVRKLHLYYIETAKSKAVPCLTQLDCSKKTIELTQLIKSQMEQIRTENTTITNYTYISILDSDVPGNQFEMALTQLAAIQMLVLSPEAVGLSKKDCDKGLEGYIHVWAVIGKMLGMEDRFNICLFNRPSILQHHVKEWFIPLLQEVDEYSVLLQEATIEASGMVVPFLFNFKSIWLHMIHEVLPHARVNIIWNSMTLGDKFKYYCMKLILVLARFSGFTKMIVNLYLLIRKVMLWRLNK